jgi:hypothetical protein
MLLNLPPEPSKKTYFQSFGRYFGAQPSKLCARPLLYCHQAKESKLGLMTSLGFSPPSCWGKGGARL